MNLTEKKFRELIRLLIKNQISELNSTSNIDGYSTPYAFDKEETKNDHKKNIKKSAEVLILNFQMKSTKTIKLPKEKVYFTYSVIILITHLYRKLE